MNGAEWRQTGVTLLSSANYHAAVAAFLRARALGETGTKFSCELAIALWQLGDQDNALGELFRAAEEDRNSFDLAITVARFLGERGEKAFSARWLARALEIGSDDQKLVAQARFNRAMAVLADGDWETGWKEYESRHDLYALDFPTPPVPMWKGNASLDGKLIWVTSEQGQGDQIQFSRYVPWLRSLSAQIIFDSHGELCDFSFAGDVLTRSMGAAGKWKVPDLDGRKPDYYVPLMSLAHRHKTTQKNVPPAPNWYRKLSSSFSVRLDGHQEGKKKIGLVWAGNPNHPGDAGRSMDLRNLLPLTGNADCEFYSFQIGKRAKDIEECGAEPLIRTILPIAYWPQTAAAMLQLDALVTVDTACAHLAGSLGIKTLMMITTDPDWRWGMKDETTPWYPSMTIIRQPKKGDWRGVALRVAEEIARL